MSAATMHWRYLFHANLSSQCPGIYNADNGASDPLSRFPGPQARVKFTESTTFSGPSFDLCYLGSPPINDSTPVSEVLEVDCDAIASNAPRLGVFPIVVLDTREVSSLDLGGIGDAEFACSETLVSARGRRFRCTNCSSSLTAVSTGYACHWLGCRPSNLVRLNGTVLPLYASHPSFSTHWFFVRWCSSPAGASS